MKGRDCGEKRELASRKVSLKGMKCQGKKREGGGGQKSQLEVQKKKKKEIKRVMER